MWKTFDRFAFSKPVVIVTIPLFMFMLALAVGRRGHRLAEAGKADGRLRQ